MLVPFLRGYINVKKLYNSLMDNKKYDSLLFKSKASPILQNLLIPFLEERLFRCVLQLHAGHDLRYGDFSGPPQRWPYFLHFKGSIFTTPKEPPQRFFLNRHISRYLNFNSQAYFEISIPQHGKKKSIKKPMSKFINYFFCLKKISLIWGV